ncbi:hypothetical protein GIB67_015942 [Kingdonia uniflora]|uniref:5'-nucleotidase n=1 Tax=Kingdonia uniflora TaxID=39325 RepID=A0A7J7PC99_9MAGN|nr:hypothetical protein GIB67_015942 [Kingdonia uniflora]
MNEVQTDELTPESQKLSSDDVWSSPGWSCKIDMRKQVFCSRSLNMKNIVVVGFDMDYTLAQYMPKTFDFLAYDGTIEKLANDQGHLSELLKWTFEWEYMVNDWFLIRRETTF